MSADRQAVTVLRRLPSRRPFLVCIRAGDQSRHREWFKPREPRQWDLMLSHYNPVAAPDEDAEIIVSGGLSKFSSVTALHAAMPDLFPGYDALLFLDDDVVYAFSDIDRLFGHFRSNDLVLAQSSLDHNSHSSWTITLRCPSFQLRYTNFVEIMMPIFSRSAFLACVDSFDRSISGYGLDFAWPAILGRPQRKIAIIDAVAAVHSRPIDRQGGAFYIYLRSLGIEPFDEFRDVLRFYGATAEPQVLGGILEAEAGGGRRMLIEIASD